MMSSTISVFTLFLSLLSAPNNANWKSYCNYIIEPGFPTSGLYTGFSTKYQTVTIEARAYSLNFCNWAYDWRINEIVSYEYQCCNNDQDVCVSIYEGITDCNGNPAVTYTYTKAANADYNCGGQSCLLALTRFNNPTNTTCDIQPNNRLNLYGLVNGGCAFGTEIGYQVYASCDPADATYFMQGIYPQSDDTCVGNQGGSKMRIDDSSCPPDDTDSDPNNNVFGSLGYTLDSCSGMPQTTMPATTTYTTTTATTTTYTTETPEPTNAPSYAPTESPICPDGRSYTPIDECNPNPCNEPCDYEDDLQGEIGVLPVCRVNPCGCIAEWVRGDRILECDDGDDDGGDAAGVTFKLAFVAVVVTSFLV